MDNIISQIEKIREINNQHKLVIFVGAGVSKNSGVCSWWELVRDIAVKIGYDDICEKCVAKYEHHSECGNGYEFCSSNNRCYWKYNYSADEFLKIPQYFFEMMGKEEYEDFLRRKFHATYLPNAINQLIIELNPEHIITTNYDHLIEDVKHPNVSNYTIIKNDRDLLEKKGRRYIIKMHGDISDIENLVLKEDDYLTYSYSHEIIESYIKSLLFDKTFLFVGYSLNDNNLKLIMSYIDNYVKNNKINNRTPHYLVVNNPANYEREYNHWIKKEVELVDISKIKPVIKKNTKCGKLESEQGKLLHTFLMCIRDNSLCYDDVAYLKRSILKEFSSAKVFGTISATSLLKACHFRYPYNILSTSIHFFDENDYRNIESILTSNDKGSKEVKEIFVKSGLYSIQCYGKNHELISCYIENVDIISDELFELSLQNKYIEIENILSQYPSNLEKAYYYWLIYGNELNKCNEIMSSIKEEIDSFDYKMLSDEEMNKIVIYKYNVLSLKQLPYHQGLEDDWRDFEELLNISLKDKMEYNFISNLYDDNGQMINQLNNCLIKHEEYYMKKSTTTKWGGTEYGDLFDLQSIVYDFYLFYKKNHLMLDWFNNVEKICEPYVKAILCTYYPDEYQFSNNGMGRTQVEPYPIGLIDIDIIVKHTRLNNFNSWLSYYKVFQINIDASIDIAEIFGNFCISMRCFRNSFMNEHLKIFSKLISLVELTSDQKHRILKAFITLVEPDETVSIYMLRQSLNAIWTYVQKHYDSSNELYKTLLTLMVNEQILRDPLDGETACKKLIEKLSVHADKDIYMRCTDIITKCDDKRVKSYFTFVFRKILLQYDNDYWCEFIKSTINENLVSEIYTYIRSGIITFDDELKNYFDNILTYYKKSKIPGRYTFPDHQKDTIDTLLILLLTENIATLNDIDFLKQYTEDSDLLDFLFNPDSFDYSKINIANYMWCNFINSDKYREIILNHKSEFWSKDDEKRIRLGFGDDFEKRVAYKYLFD
ncbi:MAG: hypothetical protein E7508_09510 [Ruminococcus sp.]|nr:hypothetical protein [Ruminococcus sp.]